MARCTYIDGIGSSQALDTAGEIVDLRGLDISSLYGACLNFEHESKIPSQIVGKILEAHKIFGPDDCKNDRHLHYWNKFKIPFLYIMGRLFDDKKPSSKEVAALFQDDAEHPNEPDMLGFSVEGAKIEKQGTVITRSVARKVTIANMPANKTCIAEMLPEKEKEEAPDALSSLFKGEVELLKFEPSYEEILLKKEKLEKQNQKESGMGIGNATPDMPAGAGMGATGGSAFVGSQLAMSENKKMNKALTAGSYNAAPGQLEGGVALGKENLERKSKKVNALKKKEKSHWFNRADEAYSQWGDREKFRGYMKQRMPHLADGEVDAIGRILALRKNLQAEGKLNSMYARIRKTEPESRINFAYQQEPKVDSYIKKSTDKDKK